MSRYSLFSLYLLFFGACPLLIPQIPVCGNSLIEVGEDCDDGNQENQDDCTNECLRPRCGDGIVAPDEACDDDNNTAGDGCAPDCALEFCGDGQINNLVEICDDGNTASGDGCSLDCLSDETCGNGIVDLHNLAPTQLRFQALATSCGQGVPAALNFSINGIIPNHLPAVPSECSCAFFGVSEGDVPLLDFEIDANTDPEIFASLSLTQNSFRVFSDGALFFSWAKVTLISPTLSRDVVLADIAPAGSTNDPLGDICLSGVSLTPITEETLLDLTVEEECDEGANNNDAAGAACHTSCTLPRCGDGLLDFQDLNGDGTFTPGEGELCDDGNTLPFDDCSFDCQPLELRIVNAQAFRIPGTAGVDPDDLQLLFEVSAKETGVGAIVVLPLDANDQVLTDQNGNPFFFADLIEDQLNALKTSFIGSATLEDFFVGSIAPINKVRLLLIDAKGRQSAPVEASLVAGLCGNGSLDAGEQCDDGNNRPGDSCTADCLSPNPILLHAFVVRNDDGSLFLFGQWTSLEGEISVMQVTFINQQGAEFAEVEFSGLPTAKGFQAFSLLDPTFLSNNPSFAASTAVRMRLKDVHNRLSNSLTSTIIDNFCGDGFPFGLEGCDDGNLIDGDGCTFDCQRESCGDGVVNNALDGIPTEECDDGNPIPADGCSNLCQSEFIAGCGDGVLNTAIGEVCDDGSQCPDRSTPCTQNSDCAGIGDGLCLPRNNDGCRLDCRGLEVCGDALLDPTNQELCDDGKHCADLTACQRDSDCIGIGDQLCLPRAGDGCSEVCIIEGFSCSVHPATKASGVFALLGLFFSFLYRIRKTQRQRSRGSLE